MKISKHFSKKEFACRCGCGQNKIYTQLVNMAEAFRAYANEWMPTDILGEIYMNVHCVNRCFTHNRKIGSKDTSKHVSGKAMDFHLYYKKDGKNEDVTVGLHEIAKKLWDENKILTGGLGLYKNLSGREWVHIDIGRKRTW